MGKRAQLKRLSWLGLLLGGPGLGYVWQRGQIYELGRDISRRERRLQQLQQENESRRRLLGDLRSPAYLMSRIKEFKLGLGPSQPSQLWRLNEPAREPVRPPPPQLAGTGPRLDAIP